MANGILASILSSPSLSIVDQDLGYDVWKGLQVKSVDIEVPTSVAEVPQESLNFFTGAAVQAALIEDLKSGKVLQPTVIKINAICEDVADVSAMITLFKDVMRTYKITSRSVISENMAPVELTINQSPVMLSAMKVSIKFEQAPPDYNDGYAPANAGDQKSYGVHVQATTSLTETVSSLYTKFTKYIGI